jgi:hypothetical protein
MSTNKRPARVRHGLLCGVVLATALLGATAAWGFHEKIPCAECLGELSELAGQVSGFDQPAEGNALCLACHDARLDRSGLNPPYVLHGLMELAGGSFTFTEDSDKTGHNIETVDRTLGTTPPGGIALAELGCLSCHDPHKNGNYRNLKTEINGRSTFVQAHGDPDYQANVYLSGMNGFCTACHERFAGYPAGGACPSHPVGIAVSGARHADFQHWSRLENKTTQAETPSGDADRLHDARVFCLSCHRAHASPYSDAMRWDYGLSPAGCLECHTF